jgi:uncharacterized protein
VKLSRYNLVVSDGGEFHAINLLSRTALALSPSAHELMLHLPDRKLSRLSRSERAFVGVLLSGLFVLPDDFDEIEYVRRRHLQEKHSDATLALVIAPTLGCNLGCHYCFEDKRPQSLSSDQLRAMEAWVTRDLANFRGLHIQWFGGEPLLSLGTIRSLSIALREIAEAQGKPFGAEIITNGVMLTGDVARELAELGVSRAQVTFEGNRRLHDRVRFGSGRTGTYDVLIANLQRSTEHLEVTARIHVAPYSVAGAHELLDDLAASGLAHKLARIYFAPIFNYKSSRPDQAFASDPRRFMSSRDFADAQIFLLRRARTLGFATPDLLDHSYGLCTAVGANTRIVNPDGSLTKCYMDVGALSETVGNVADGLVSGRNLDRWMEHDFTTDSECRDCTFAPVCMGGCPKQKMANADKATVCTPLKYNFEERIRLQFGRPS